MKLLKGLLLLSTACVLFSCGNKPTPTPEPEHSDEYYIDPVEKPYVQEKWWEEDMTDWEIGTEKEILINFKDKDRSNDLVYTVKLIGKNHDDLAQGDEKAKTTWEFMNVIKDPTKYNIYGTNHISWKDSYIENYLNNSNGFFDRYLPQGLLEAIRPVKKKCIKYDIIDGGQSITYETTIDRFFSLSMIEMFSEEGIKNSNLEDIKVYSKYYIGREETSQEITNGTVTNEGTQYEYWKKVLGDSDPHSLGFYSYTNFEAVKRYPQQYFDGQQYWLRTPLIYKGAHSAYPDYSYGWYINELGHAQEVMQLNEINYAPAFCI